MTKIKNKSSKKNNNRMKRLVKQMIQSHKEIKNFAVANTFVNTVAGTVTPITQGIIQGDNINQRSGDVVFPLYINLNLTFLGGVGSTQSFHRFIVFQDMLNTGASPVVSDILDGSLFNSTYAVIYRQQRRFKILYDKLFGVVAGANSNASHDQVKIKLKRKIEYNGTSNVLASNGPGSVWFLTLTDSVTVATATMAMYASTFYTDA
jgi:hypothetical protein